MAIIVPTKNIYQQDNEQNFPIKGITLQSKTIQTDVDVELKPKFSYNYSIYKKDGETENTITFKLQNIEDENADVSTEYETDGRRKLARIMQTFTIDAGNGFFAPILASNQSSTGLEQPIYLDIDYTVVLPGDRTEEYVYNCNFTTYATDEGEAYILELINSKEEFADVPYTYPLSSSPPIRTLGFKAAINITESTPKKIVMYFAMVFCYAYSTNEYDNPQFPNTVLYDKRNIMIVMLIKDCSLKLSYREYSVEEHTTTYGNITVKDCVWNMPTQLSNNTKGERRDQEPLIDYLANGVIEKYKFGNTNIDLKCDFNEYYNEDGTLAISPYRYINNTISTDKDDFYITLSGEYNSKNAEWRNTLSVSLFDLSLASKHPIIVSIYVDYYPFTTTEPRDFYVTIPIGETTAKKEWTSRYEARYTTFVKAYTEYEKMTFEIGDKVLPMVNTASGDVNFIERNGVPSVFEITSVNFINDGACWQEITAVETAK